MPVLRCEQSSESKAQQEMPKEKKKRTFLLEAIAFIFQMFVSTRRKMFMNSVRSLLFQCSQVRLYEQTSVSLLL